MKSGLQRLKGVVMWILIHFYILGGKWTGSDCQLMKIQTWRKYKEW